MTRRSLALLSLALIAPALLCSQDKPASSTEPQTPEAIRQYNDQQMAELRKQIAGKEKQSSATVYKNVQILAGVPAENLLRIMDVGFSRSLGVSCQYCHVPGMWERDDKAPKHTARDMWRMTHTINDDLLQKMEYLKDRAAVVNCTACHRGQVKPALDLAGSH